MEKNITEEKTNNLIIQIDEKPKPSVWFFLSIQHVFAMFGATILVPILTGYPVSVAIFASGIGTLIYIFCTKRKVPVYLGSSFAYITAVVFAVDAMGGDISAAQTGLILVGIIYIAVALLIKVVGKNWIDKLLPPIVIGPMIAVIGLGLAGSAVSNAGFTDAGTLGQIMVAIITFLTAALISTKAKGFMKIVPFLIAIIVGYVFAVILPEIASVFNIDIGGRIVDFTPFETAQFFQVPEFAFPFKLGDFRQYDLYFGPETIAMLPVAIVTISEHIGDHTVLGKICGKNFLKDPGLDRTLIGDGVATAVSGFIGGPANTTYGENTGVIGMTRIGSVYVIMGAAVFAIFLSFCGYVSAAIQTIPACVLGGMGIMLYGVIASNGLRVLVDNQVDFSQQRNLIIASAMLVIGLGGAVFPLGEIATLSGTALSAVVGVLLNLILPKPDKEHTVEL
ncbi:uracil permease [Breznakia sp. PF5-3]|uniref:uracil-xanthine permease family protein n=1 Tax=unclassified Breznakia TaxID=2623764 RepID=UPI002406EC52|nr:MULTISPECIES: solute carrier family 23 protein [unclassified Breznakia]MDF9825591.1 uracil permease [Breznakia sp. PM6-1]MDF9836418.1 uracil permease [Breznakia sp. PF5-3]MDF9838574.1 uracil permease [Breznakia sp. PFB2-8]MDF9860579.1 uracil permease [Breznakia sp. PH5-24]